MSEIKIQKWSPIQGGYQKRCPICSTVFWGRLNKRYCCAACKTKENNDRARSRRESERKTTGPLMGNVLLFASMLEGTDGNVTVKLDELENTREFDPTAPRSSFKERTTGKLWHRYGDYALHVNEIIGEVIIKRLEQ